MKMKNIYSVLEDIGEEMAMVFLSLISYNSTGRALKTGIALSV
jgi:hypothetical protein